MIIWNSEDTRRPEGDIQLLEELTGGSDTDLHFKILESEHSESNGGITMVDGFLTCIVRVWV